MSHFKRETEPSVSESTRTPPSLSKSNRRSPIDVDDAVAAFQAGDPVLIHDATDREGETDLVYPAQAVTPSAVTRMRNDAGGLICVAVADRVARQWDLPFLQEALDHPATVNHDLGYDDRSSFSLTVNHRDTYTGITDDDRAYTIAAIGRGAATPETLDFPAAFRTPGHVHLLRAAPDLVADREGHTELSLLLTEAAGLPPAAVVCEMLDDETGRALLPSAAKRYADRNSLHYVEGTHLIEGLG